MYDNVNIDYTIDVVETEGISLPYRYMPYPHQAELLDTFFDMLEGNNNYSRFGLEWHRRAGKDMTFWQLIVAAAITNVGDYCYMLPTNVQSTKVIWNSNVNDMDMVMCKFFDFIPPSMRKDEYKSERRIELNNGSNIYVVGSDNYDSNVGMNAKGVVYSEWSLCDPKAQEFFDPMLMKHRELDKTAGWALYCWTPRGKNHAYETRQIASSKENEGEWYFSSLTVDNTADWEGNPIISRESIDRALRNGADPDIVQQEYYLDYAAAVTGVVYGHEVKRAYEEGRVVDIFDKNDPIFDPRLPVLCFWDIGFDDANSIWTIQKPRNSKDKRLIVLDYYQASGHGMDHYVKYLKDLQVELGFKYFGNQYLPHDGRNHEWGSGERREDSLRKHFPRVEVIKRISRVENGVYQTKSIFDQFIFDAKRCSGGLKCLENYQYKVTNGIANGFKHDEYSHGADSFRQIGQLYGVLPDEASDNILQQLTETWNEGVADDFGSYNPLKG